MKVEISIEEIMKDARPIGTRIAKEVAEIANKNGKHQAGTFGGLIASLVLQNVLTGIAVSVFEPGSEKGKEWLKRMYEMAEMDALQRWDAQDLKDYFTRGEFKQ